MSGQEQQRHTRRDDEPDEVDTPAPPAAGAPEAQSQDDGIDALLDEIDGTLEENAESFVRGFVQKGGQ